MFIIYIYNHYYSQCMESHKIHVPNHQSVYIHKMIEHGMDLDGPEIIWNPHALPPESIRLWCQPCLRSMFHEHILDEIFDIVQDQVWHSDYKMLRWPFIFVSENGPNPQKIGFWHGKIIGSKPLDFEVPTMVQRMVKKTHCRLSWYGSVSKPIVPL